MVSAGVVKAAKPTGWMVNSGVVISGILTWGKGETAKSDRVDGERWSRYLGRHDLRKRETTQRYRIDRERRGGNRRDAELRQRKPTQRDRVDGQLRGRELLSSDIRQAQCTDTNRTDRQRRSGEFLGADLWQGEPVDRDPPEGPRLDDDVGEGEGGDVDCADREADAVDLTSTHGNGPSINKGRRCISEAANLREYPGHIGLQGSDVVRNEHHQISYRNAVKAKGGKIDDTRICLRGYAGSAKAAYTYLGCTY